MKNYATMIATAFLGGAMTLGGYKLFIDKRDAKQEALELLSRPALVQTNYTTPERTPGGRSVHGVIAWIIWVIVHILALVTFKNRITTTYD